MHCTRTTALIAAHLLTAPLVAIVLLAPGQAAAANPTYYNSLNAFQVDVTSTVTDDYSNPAYVFQQSNDQMSGVIGETDYFTTGFDNWNLISGGYYCAGCNGSFELSFQTTSVGDANGVNGVGVLVTTNSAQQPYFAFITFADGETADIQLPGANTFWGVSAPERIERIHFGLSGGVSTTGGSFGIDNLIVGDGIDLTPCGDGITQDPEECDDMGASAACDGNCTLAICGDGTFNELAGEECDEGEPTAECNADCTAVACGDGLINEPAGETCDDMGESPTCDIDCTAAGCGDNVANAAAGEECDDSAESPVCDADCTLVICGDGIENNTAGEFCDDGNNDDGDGCSAACTNEQQSTTEGGESSDGGSTEGGETTDATANPSETGETAGESSGGETAADDSGGDTGSASGTGSASASAGDSSGAATASASDTSGGPGSGGDSGATPSDPASGCGCATDDGPRGIAWSVIAVLGLGAATRRRRRG